MCLGVPGRILSIECRELRMARVEFGGIIKEVCLAYVPEAHPGDYVIVHAGFAISRVDDEQAQQIFTYLEQIDALTEVMGRKS